MIQIKVISGDPEHIERELAFLLSAGWEILDISTNLYNSTGGMRKETTVYLRTNIQA